MAGHGGGGDIYLQQGVSRRRGTKGHIEGVVDERPKQLILRAGTRGTSRVREG